MDRDCALLAVFVQIVTKEIHDVAYDPNWAQIPDEWEKFSAIRLDPSKPANLYVILGSIAEDFGGPYHDEGPFDVEINNKGTEQYTLSRLVYTKIVIPASSINPDGTTWIKIYGTPWDFHYDGTEAKVSQ